MQIEAGKFYRTRDGRKVGPMSLQLDLIRGGTFVDASRTFTGQAWYADGTFIKGAVSDADLVAEWTPWPTQAYFEPSPAPAEHEDEGYDGLSGVLHDALMQAASGKGKERHANGKPFAQQPIMEIGRLLSSVCDGELFQAIKKAQEASGMLARGQLDAAERELLGGINYLAAAVLLIREHAEASR